MAENAIMGYRTLLEILVEEVGIALPDGFDSWGFKTVNGLRQTMNGFTWPAVGGVASSWDDDGPHSSDECPIRPGDGLCVALTPKGASSGFLPLAGLLLVAYRQADVVAATHEKLRTRGEVAVVGDTMIRRLNLRGAYLYGAYLRGTNLEGTNLEGAYLRGAALEGANLYGANLRGATLEGAALYGANLYGTNLEGAYLRGASLRGANLYGADPSALAARGAIL